MGSGGQGWQLGRQSGLQPWPSVLGLLGTRACGATAAQHLLPQVFLLPEVLPHRVHAELPRHGGRREGAGAGALQRVSTASESL